MTNDRRNALRKALLRCLPGAGVPAVLTAGAPSLPLRPRTLLVRPDHLGDVLFVGPALTTLRARWPGAHVTLLVGPWAAPIAERLPGADRVLTLEFPWFDRQPKGAPWRPYVRLVRAARWLRTTAALGRAGGMADLTPIALGGARLAAANATALTNSVVLPQ